MSVWLGRWRVGGTNWEGRQWYLTLGALPLINEIMAIYPEKTGLDGTVASQGHDARSPRSDHRPRPVDASPAVVRALDVGEAVEDDGIKLFEMLRRTQDPRIKYVLHEDQIFSSYPRGDREPWEVHKQSVGHPSHVHISFTDLADTNDSPWGLEGDEYMPFTEHEVQELKKIVSSLDEVNSGGAFAREAVKLIRKERTLPLHEPTLATEGLQRGDTVKLV